MKKVENFSHLVKDTKVLNLSTQTTSCILLNGSKKSKAQYDVRGYLDYMNDDSIEYITVSMPYAVIANSNYILNSNNSTLAFTVGALSYLIQIQAAQYGNYTASTFLTLMNSLMGFYGLSATMNTITNTFTFSSLSPFSLDDESTCDYIIGYSGQQVAVINGAGTYKAVMPRSFNFLPIPRFVVHCSLMADGILLGSNSTPLCSDVLATIPNASKPGSQLVYENLGSEFMLRSFDLDQFVITITDDNNREIDFRGISSYFQMKFTIFRQSMMRPLRFNELVHRINIENPNPPGGGEEVM